MGIFNSYVKLPEGIFLWGVLWQRCVLVKEQGLLKLINAHYLLRDQSYLPDTMVVWMEWYEWCQMRGAFTTMTMTMTTMMTTTMMMEFIVPQRSQMYPKSFSQKYAGPPVCTGLQKHFGPWFAGWVGGSHWLRGRCLGGFVPRECATTESNSVLELFLSPCMWDALCILAHGIRKHVDAFCLWITLHNMILHMNINISNNYINMCVTLHYMSYNYAMLFIVQFYIFEFELDVALSPFENMPDITSAQSCHSLSVWSAGRRDRVIFVGHSWASHGNLGIQQILGTRDILGPRMIWCALQERGK